MFSQSTLPDTHDGFYLQDLKLLQWVILAFFVFLGVACIYLTRTLQVSVELSHLEGWLYPADEPMPPSPCSVAYTTHPEGLFVFLGPVIGGGDQFPHTVLSIHSQKRLVLDKRPDGSVAISLDVLSDDGRVITRIDKGQFFVNPNNYFRMTRSDRSSLSIIDQRGVEVLRMRYFNKRGIWINAVLHYIDKTVVFTGDRNQGNVCGFDNGVDFNIE